MKYEEIENDVMLRNFEKTQKRGKIMGGFMLVLGGSLFLARELGAEIPYWVLTWKMALVAIGLIIGVKHKFMHPGWIIITGIGAAFLINDLYPDFHIRPLIWPVLAIAVGLIIIFKPRNKHYFRQRRHMRKWRARHFRDSAHFGDVEIDKEDYIDSTAFMAGVQKNVISKKFRGGEITNVFGGHELNLSQAEIDGKATLEITTVFGGTRLVVPSNWEIRTELVTTFGSVEDKRSIQPDISGETGKILVLTGTTFCGGIEIKNY